MGSQTRGSLDQCAVGTIREPVGEGVRASRVGAIPRAELLRLHDSRPQNIGRRVQRVAGLAGVAALLVFGDVSSHEQDEAFLVSTNQSVWGASRELVSKREAGL